MKVAIDGPAGSGKSTVAHALAERYGLTLLDTGAMYRSVTLACQVRGVSVEDTEAVAALSERVAISFGKAADGSQTVSLDGKDVTADIRTPQIDANVSAVAAIPRVREAMVDLQRQMGAEGDVVAEGRDIGTVVFPDAEVKVFLVADPQARAHRRALQRAIQDEDAEQEILEDLKRRDAADSSREVAPLRPAEDAYHMDSSSMTVDEEVAVIAGLMEQARAAASRQPVGKDPAAPVRRDAEEQAPVAADRVTTEQDGSAPTNKQPAPKSRPKKEKAEAKKGPLRVFGHNTVEDYYDHPMREFPITSRALMAVTIWVCGAVSKTLWPWTLENGEELWNADGGRMVVMNHVSMIDPVIIAVSDWIHGRRMRPIYKSEIDKHPFITWFFARVGAMPVKRGTADIKAVRRAQRALQNGEDVLVFPEGTRIRSDDQEVTIHGGFALMAQLAKVPVLPVAISGARDGTPGGNKPLRPHRIWMSAGKVITFDELGVKGRKKQAKAMEQAAMECVYALRDALRKRHPGRM